MSSLPSPALRLLHRPAPSLHLRHEMRQVLLARAQAVRLHLNAKGFAGGGQCQEEEKDFHASLISMPWHAFINFALSLKTGVATPLLSSTTVPPPFFQS